MMPGGAGGQLVYFGPTGYNSLNVISYFEAIPGTPRLEHDENPATWMLGQSVPHSLTGAGHGQTCADWRCSLCCGVGLQSAWVRARWAWSGPTTWTSTRGARCAASE